MKAVARKFLRRDVAPDDVGRGALSEQLTDEVVKVLVGAGDVLALMQAGGQFSAVMHVRNAGVRGQDPLQPRADIAWLAANGHQLVEMVADLAGVPGNQDGLDIREVFVEGRPADAGRFSNLRHRDRPHPVGSDQSGRRIEDRIADLAPVRRDRRVPQLRHGPSIVDRFARRVIPFGDIVSPKMRRTDLHDGGASS